MLKLIRKYYAECSGATAIEYGLIAAGISLAIIAVVFTFGDQLEITFTSMEDAMTEANANLDDGGATP